MTYALITDQAESMQMFEGFKNGFSRGSKVFPKHVVGFQGGHKKCDVYWRSDLEVWGLFEPEAVRGRFWTCYGTENPTRRPGFNITVEINPPTSGINLRCAGAFLRDGSGNGYVAHSGKIGGGRKGVGKAAFRDSASALEWERIRVYGRSPIELLILGKIGTDELSEQIKQFVELVAEFKRRHTGSA